MLDERVWCKEHGPDSSLKYRCCDNEIGHRFTNSLIESMRSSGKVSIYQCTGCLALKIQQEYYIALESNMPVWKTKEIIIEDPRSD